MQYHNVYSNIIVRKKESIKTGRDCDKLSKLIQEVANLTKNINLAQELNKCY